MGETKQRRIAAAAFAAALKRARHTSALSIAALRAASARAVMLDELSAQHAGGEPFLQEHGRALTELEVNSASRASVMMPLFYASLNVVVEGWQRKGQPEPRLTDPEIDLMLASPFTEALRKYRQAMMHPSLLDDPGATGFAAVHSDLSRWAAKLTEEFLRYFREWKQSTQVRSTGPIPPAT